MSVDDVQNVINTGQLNSQNICFSTNDIEADKYYRKYVKKASDTGEVLLVYEVQDEDVVYTVKPNVLIGKPIVKGEGRFYPRNLKN